ncbi:MAG: SulP family inorganic anion transporter [Burkholderiales bacterium]|nr:SulP family inorganic anion transporter [Burkholderiales bacterium]
MLSRLTPFRNWWPLVDRASQRADTGAGLTGALLVLPQGLAYAVIAGLPPQYGLYCAIGPAIVAALFGSSLHMVSGPTAAISIVVFSALAGKATVGSAAYVALALTLGCMVGLIQLVMAALRVGRLAESISHAVVVGFTSGAAFLIAASQIKHFFGLTIPPVSGFFQVLAADWHAFSGMSGWAAATGLVTLVTGIACRRLVPRAPYMIVAMVVGALAAAAFKGWDPAARIAVVGALDVRVPPLSMPTFDASVWASLFGSALAIAILAITEAIAIARALALKSGQKIDGTQEFVGQGLSNVAGSFLSGYPSSGSFTRSGLNLAAGARTPLAAVYAALFLMLIVLFIAPLAAWLPMPSMAAVLFIVATGLLDAHELGVILSGPRGEAVTLVATFAATLLFALEIAVFVGIAVSLLMRRLQRSGGTR